MKPYHLALWVLLTLPALLQAGTPLVLSGNLRLEVPAPSELAHLNSVMIVRFPNGWVSHRYEEARNFLGMNMQGLLTQYFCFEFSAGNCDPKTPRWLQVMAQDNALAIGLEQGEKTIISLPDRTGYGIYFPSRGKGMVFLPEDRGVDILEYRGGYKGFRSLTGSIREGK